MADFFGAAACGVGFRLVVLAVDFVTAAVFFPAAFFTGALFTSARATLARATFLTFVESLPGIRAGFVGLDAALPTLPEVGLGAVVFAAVTALAATALPFGLAFAGALRAAAFEAEAFAARFAVPAAGFFFAAGFFAMDGSSRIS